MDAEAAANSAAIQLVSFKDAMEDEFAVCYLQFCVHQVGFKRGSSMFRSHSPSIILTYSSLAIKDSRRCAIDKRRITRQRGLLLEKLEDFRRINKSVRQKLKQLQDTEVSYNTSTLFIAHDHSSCSRSSTVIITFR